MTEQSKDLAPRAGAKKGQTRDSIRLAARKLFAARPIDAVSIDAIVAAAGVSKGSFYNHFTDREDVVEAVVGEIRRSLNEAAVAANTDETDPARRVARAVCLFLRSAVDDPEAAAALVRIHGGYLALDGAYNKPVVDDISAGLAAGRFAIPTLESGVMLVIAVTQVGLMRVIQEPGLALAVAKAQQMVLLLLRGLGVETVEAGRIAAQIADEVVRVGPQAREAAVSQTD
jgi:AcrR family transcriptional regulator